MKYLIHALVIIFSIISCVGPEETYDGLYKNSPVVVNTSESFTFSLRGENYTTEENYTLTFPNSNPIQLTTVLVVTDYASRSTDTSYFDILNSNDSLLANYQLTNNINVAPVENVPIEAIPNKIYFKADNFSGVVQLVIAIGD